MILIADSGATKTNWCLVRAHSDYRIVQTEGINPFHQTEEKISGTICRDLMSQLSKEDVDSCTEVHFFGAGCLPVNSGIIIGQLLSCFPQATVTADTDLLGAAHAVCGHNPGIACILGTGSNSCLYDGARIVKNVSPLGYILGDEGSGAYLGKRFIGDCLKGLLPATLKKGLFREFALTQATILQRVYMQPEANRFLGSVVPYIYDNRHVPEVAALLDDCFREFFRRNVVGYSSDMPVSFTGSVAWFFQEEVTRAAQAAGLKVGRFVRNPIEGMVEYYFS